MTTLSTIVYVSAATMPMTSHALESLLLQCRELNLASGVTGVLLYTDGSFMQCLEGTPEAVALTYARIKHSRRHTGIIELYNEPASTRSFPDWQMACARTTDSILLTLSSARWAAIAPQTDGPAGPAPGLELLQQFWKNAR